MDGRFDSLMLPYVNAECRQVFLDEVAQRYPNDNIVMILDGAEWHKRLSFALPENLKLHFLPPYSPELNPVEHLWDEFHGFSLSAGIKNFSLCSTHSASKTLTMMQGEIVAI